MTAAREVQRYPLAWPLGWRRTPAGARKRAVFGKVEQRANPGAGYSYAGKRRLSLTDGIARLEAELRRLGAEQEVLSTNLRVRLDGLPRGDGGEPTDTGAAVYFHLKGQARCLACDRWDRVADNVAAIALHVEALRAIERWGVGTTEQAFAGYLALRPSAAEWRIVLGVRQTATLTDVEEAFRRLAKELHPDSGGTHDDMARLNEAREAARREFGAPA